jgi:hypothetical protein
MSDNLKDEQAHTEREKFENEFKTILTACDSAGVLVRALGSLAFQIHCPQYGYLQTAPYGDIDLASYTKYSRQIRDVMTNLGYEENRKIFVLSEAHRALFYKSNSNLRVDIFYEMLDFCHTIQLRDRLEYDAPTIPLAELLLEKMQIVHISEKDVVNVIMLLLEHPVGEINNETINIKLIARLCADDWGLWHTTTLNLNKVKHFVQEYNQLTPEQKSKAESQVNEILLRLYAEPKSFSWKVRDQMGDRVQWYKDVDDI